MRWGGFEELWKDGWGAVPVAFLKYYAHLQAYGGLTVTEAMFIIQLMAFKWGDKAPFPSYKRLAKRMGVTDKMVRRYAAQLEGKGYLKRESRIGSSNAFDLSTLFASLAVAAAGLEGSKVA